MSRIPETDTASIRFEPRLGRKELMLAAMISPIGCALISLTIFAISVLIIPPSLYERVLHEPDLMFWNWKVVLFVCGCIGCYSLGTLAYRRIYGSPIRQGPRSKATPSRSDWRHALVALIALTLASALNAYSVATFMGHSGNIIGGLLSGVGESVKQSIDSSNALTEALPLLFATIWWATIKYQARKEDVRELWGLVRLALWAATILAVATTIVKLARYDLVPFLIGVTLIYCRGRILTGKVTNRFLSILFVYVPIALLGIFAAFSYLRGAQNFDQQLRLVFGYGPASYNRLALELDGHLRYDGYGFGGYTLQFVEFFPLVHQFIDIPAIFHLPSYQEVFFAQFNAIQQSGLQSGFIWCTSFGYDYSDVGFFVFPLFCVIGFLTQAAWSGWVKGNGIGTVMYPFMAGTVLLWSTGNLLTQPRLVTFMATALILEFGCFYLIRVSTPKHVGASPRFKYG